MKFTDIRFKHILREDRNPELRQFQEEMQEPINRFKTWMKRHPRAFQWLKQAVGGVSFFGEMPKQTLRRVFTPDELNDKIIVNLGSGTRRIHPEVINIDLFPFDGVDLVADAAALPIRDASVDMVISESTLEHIPDAQKAIHEMIRVVKPGGYVYVSIPFLFPYHASPNDYFRLTHEGLKKKFSAFEPVKIGMLGGPASTFVTFFMYFLALPFSLLSKNAYDFATYAFMVVLSPLRIFDLLFFLFPKSIDVAAVVYFIGRKK